MDRGAAHSYRESAGQFLRESRFVGAGWLLGTLGTLVGIALRGLRSAGAGVAPMIPELIIGVSFVTVFAASTFAYHKLRLSHEPNWDEDALRITESSEVPLPSSEEGGSYMARLAVFSKKSLPQPNRIRFWFNRPPESQRLEARVSRHHGARYRPPVLLTPENSTISVTGSLLEVSYVSPPLDDPDHYLAVWVWAHQPIRVVRSAGYRIRG